jgi:uncharacterized protein
MPDWSRVELAWDERNEELVIERHGVYPEEVEQVFFNRPHVRREGDRYTAYGRDDDGDFLFVVFDYRNGIVRVVTARPMDPDERRLYDRHR